MLIRRYLSDASGAGAPDDTAQAADTTPLEGAQDPTQDAGTETPTGGTVGTLTDLQPDQQPDSVDNLPDWAQKVIKELRGENASRRTAEKQAEKEAEAATRKAAEEQGKYKELYEAEFAKREAAEAQTRELELGALKAKVAADVGLPAQLATRLAGETEDELKADAQAVLAVLPKSTIGNDAQQGTGGVGSQTPQMTPEEIREFAARMGVDAQYVKPEDFRIKK